MVIVAAEVSGAMLRYTVSLVPRGDESKAIEIGRAEVWNVGGNASATSGDYGARLRGGFPGWGGKGSWKRGTVTGFPRKRLGAWDLFYRSMAACIADRSTATRGPTDNDAPHGPSLDALTIVLEADPLVMAGIVKALDAMGVEGAAVAELVRGINGSNAITSGVKS